MSKYTFAMIHGDGTKTYLSGSKEYIGDVLEDFKTFLLGCTFHPDNVDQIDMDSNCTEAEYNGN